MVDAVTSLADGVRPGGAALAASLFDRPTSLSGVAARSGDSFRMLARSAWLIARLCASRTSLVDTVAPSLELGRLEPVDPRLVWTNEAHDFTPWLLANADRLSAALGIDLELEAAEHLWAGIRSILSAATSRMTRCLSSRINSPAPITRISARC